jgi:UDP-N-acetylmuramate--alanine ligase
MHIYFSGIGGTGLGPLALIAKQAGFTVSGSDKQDSSYIGYLKKQGITSIHIGQEYNDIAEIHTGKPIDWFVYTTAVTSEQTDPPELKFCRDNRIKITKRDELLNHILEEKNLEMIAVAGTHGKTTTTAMAVWLLKQLHIPVSYSVGAKLPFGDMGHYEPSSTYFVYEADEYARNFLSFYPRLSIIVGIDYDHPDIYPTRDEYEQAFAKFINQSDSTVMWHSDVGHVPAVQTRHVEILNDTDEILNKFSLVGEVNRRNAWQVVHAIHQLTGKEISELIPPMNNFPGLSRRFELLRKNLYTDYAHTPPKIRGAIQTAHEVAGENVVVVYEGLHNTRQHFIKEELADLFESTKQLYIVPSYLAREDPNLALLSPEDLRNMLSDNSIPKTHACQLDTDLHSAITAHLEAGDLVLCLTAGGGGSLDEWLRKTFPSQN